MNWDIVIGLEVHAELSTKTKIFCGCDASFGGEPNTRVCPICAGLPGALPKLNKMVVEYALRTGVALQCKINQRCMFDRKNYFYPDLPKAYQVSQLYAPICVDGHLEIEINGQKKIVGIREIHMEEDAGKLLHDGAGGYTLIDYNRSGVPLLEIVSLPDMSCAEEAVAYLEQLREILMYLDVCDCKMQEGSMRADINLSVRPVGEKELGVRTEMKNMNSFKAIGRAIEFESNRQIEILEKGGKIIQQTLRWDDDKGMAFEMRTKENAQDYRYFPEPDLLPLLIDDHWLRNVAAELPELAKEKRTRYMQTFGLSRAEASVLTTHKKLSDLFESIAMASGSPKEAANLVTGEILRLLGKTGTPPDALSLDGKKFAALIGYVLEGKINRSAYKETVQAVFERDVDPEKYIEEKGLLMLKDDSLIEETVAAVLAENEKSVADFRDGKEKAFGYLMGQAMKRLEGKGDPAIMEKALKVALGL